MKPFLEQFQLALTPLSPIHIGCAEDYDPTNYLIEDGVLYNFDPSLAVLNEKQKNDLSKVVLRPNLLAIQRFFEANSETFKIQAQHLLPVAEGVAAQYTKQIGNVANQEASGKDVINALTIERNMYIGSNRQAYIPGSTFKGAIRTAMVDALNNRNSTIESKSQKLEDRLLGGDFSASPLRLLKVSDFMPTTEPQCEVLFATNKKKKLVERDGREVNPKGITTRKECILHGQYRQFTASITIQDLFGKVVSSNTKDKNPNPQLSYQNLVALAKDNNQYNLIRLHNELKLLESRQLINLNWLQSFNQLFSGAIEKQLHNGTAFLIRLGRYGGAESKTLSGKGVAKIKIMQGPGKQPTYEEQTLTVWLATSQNITNSKGLPFGWAIVEINPSTENTALKNWCQTVSAGRKNIALIKQQFKAEKEQATIVKLEQQQQALAKQLAKQAEELQKLEKENARQNMSDASKAIDVFTDACQDYINTKLPPNGNYKKLVADVGKAGLYQDANNLVKKALDTEANFWTAEEKLNLANVIETSLAKVIDRWDAKEQRKKLRINALKGQ